MPQEVYVYWNITRKLWSIASTNVGGTDRHRLLRHAVSVTLKDARFVVREATRQTVIRKGSREVHAGVIGTLVEAVPPSDAKAVTYNPYRGGTFTYCGTVEAVSAAGFVHFGSSKYPLVWE